MDRIQGLISMYFMNVPRLPIILAIFMFAGLSMISETHADPTLQRAGTLLSGDYLSNNYIAALTSKLSPHNSVNEKYPQLIEIKQKNQKTYFLAIINFHEGAMAFSLSKNGNVQVEDGFSLDTKAVHLKVLDRKTFSLKLDKYPNETYSYVGNVSRYVADKVLVGIYVDSHGKHYSFSKNGIAIFPNRQFKYLIGVDTVLNPFDYYLNEDSNITFGFKRSGNKLVIFKTHGEISQYIDAHPMLSLTKIGDGN